MRTETQMETQPNQTHRLGVVGGGGLTAQSNFQIQTTSSHFYIDSISQIKLHNLGETLVLFVYRKELTLNCTQNYPRRSGEHWDYVSCGSYPVRQDSEAWKQSLCSLPQ